MADQPMTLEQFGASIKTKYPDYASVPDAELGQRMLDKYPEYRDRVSVQVPMNQATVNGQKVDLGESPLIRAATEFYKKSPLATVVDTAKGAANVAAHPIDTLFGIIPVAETVRDLAKAHWDEAVKAAQKTKAAYAAATGGNGTEAGLSAIEAMGHGLAAALPVLGPAAANVGEHGAAGDVAGMVGGTAGLLAPFGAKAAVEARRAPNPAKADLVSREAEQQVADRVLAPGNPRYKGTAQALAPEILDRKLEGGRIELQQMADEGEAAAGQRIDASINAHGGPKLPIATRPIVAAITDRIKELSPGGKAIPTAAGRVEQLTALRDYVRDMGATVPFEDLKRVRDEFYSEAAKGRGYERAGNVPMTDRAWAAREAGSTIRQSLANLMPDTAAHYADYTFWKNLNDVLDPTMGRPKQGSVTTGVTGGLHTTGAVIGSALATGPLSKLPGVGAAGALVVSKLLPMIREAQASPAWQLASASKKMALADAIRKGQIGTAQYLLLNMAASAPRGAAPMAASEEQPTPARVQR